ncbi:DEAD/DEAH box helicase [Thermogymnomonas acidicola]|uniref:DEAD/DEAH box helicase n=1 Tax=Thermogymnomonas acidicola TaxID=399579 RepID=UPI000A8A1479|nr:DEAD/DEAH box helicase [Thermogymnomonas acidicola]
MRVSDLGHPGEFLDLFGGRDFELYGHQEEAIEDFRSGHNVLLSVPTAAGKTLVAYSAILDTFARGMKSIYIVPLKALASEKFDEMKRLRSLGMRVSISVGGDYDSPPSVIRENDVVVMTGEKADSFLHHDPDVFQDVGLIVADEVHLIGERKRGPVLENVLTGARLVNPDLRVVALSATVSNYGGEIAKWLGARSVVSDFRPVKLRRGGIYYRGGRIIYDDQSIENLPKGNDLWGGLVWKFVSGGGQVLIFVNSRRRAEETARVLADASSRETEIDEDYDDDGMYQEDLFDLMRKGVAYHHAGLSLEQRALIEKMFRERQLDVIVATPNTRRRREPAGQGGYCQGYHEVHRWSHGVHTIDRGAADAGQGRQARIRYTGIRHHIRHDSRRVRQGQGLPDRGGNRASGLVLRRPGEGKVQLPGPRFQPPSQHTGKDRGLLLLNLYSLQSGIERVRPIIPAALDFLEREGFIREWDDGYRPTQFGKEVSDLYIDPESAVVLREYLAGTTSVDRACWPFRSRGTCRPSGTLKARSTRSGPSSRSAVTGRTMIPR